MAVKLSYFFTSCPHEEILGNFSFLTKEVIWQRIKVIHWAGFPVLKQHEPILKLSHSLITYGPLVSASVSAGTLYVVPVLHLSSFISFPGVLDISLHTHFGSWFEPAVQGKTKSSQSGRDCLRQQYSVWQLLVQSFSHIQGASALWGHHSHQLFQR